MSSYLEFYGELFRNKTTTENIENPDLQFQAKAGTFLGIRSRFGWQQTNSVYTRLLAKKILKRASGLSIIPFDVVFGYMDTFFGNQYLQYTETTKNKAFFRISTMFYRHLFWNNQIWVRYDKEKEIFQLWDICENKNIAEILESDEKVFEFVNIVSNKREKLNIEEDVIPVYWNGNYDRDVFLQCFVLIYKYLFDKNLVWENFQIAAKGTYLYLENSESYKKTYLNRFFDGSSLMLGAGDETDGTPKKADVLTFAEWQTAAVTVNQLFLADLTLFGGGLYEEKDKGERLSEGENFKDLKRYFDNNTVVLEWLNDFGRRAGEIWGQKLEFELINKPQTSGLNMENEESREKSPFSEEEN